MKTQKMLAGTVLLVLILFGGMFALHDNVADRIGLPAGTLQGMGAAQFIPSPVFAQTGTGNTSIADVTEQCIDSVVNVSSEKVIKFDSSPFLNNPFFRRFFEDGYQNQVPQPEQRQESLGSGVIVSEDGLILTNNHVVADATELKVLLHDDRVYEAEVVGTDPESDLAVIRLKEKNIEGLTPIKFGDSDVLRLGDVVLAIGNPFGLSHTVTMGIVSAKGRSFSETRRITEYEDFIQTDAAINPGNSGGALINMNGELVGINTAIVSQSGGYQGVGFAIPSNMAQLIMKGLVNDGKIVRGWLGVELQNVSYDIAEALEMESTDGAMIAEVLKDTPAEKAGFQKGDIILSVNGKKIETPNQLRNTVALLGADEKAEFAVLRDGKKIDIKVKLAERTDDIVMASTSERLNGRSNRSGGDEETIAGVSVVGLDQSTRERYNIPAEVDNGVVVTDVDPDSPAADIGLVEGDVIRDINNKTVESADQFKREYKNTNGKALLYIYHDGHHSFRVLKK